MMSAIALVVVAVPAGVYAATEHDHNGPPPVGSSQSPSPQPSGSPSASPSPTPSTVSSPPTTSANSVPGMYVYRLDTADGAITNDVLYRAPGGDWQKVASVKVPTVQPPNGPPPVVMAPDRQHIAWLLNGKLQISALDGSQVKTLVANVGSVSCVAPSWSADSRHLLFITIANGGHATTVQTVNVDGTGLRVLGTTTDTQGCGDLTSANGSTAYDVTFSGTAKRLIAFDGGAAPRTVAATWPSGQQPHKVIAASAGSTRLLVATTNSSDVCGCSPPEWYAVLDTATGQVTRLDNSNDKQGSAAMTGAFTPDGRVVLIANRDRADGKDPFLTVYGPDGTIVGSVPPPPMELAYFAGVDG